eukprot:6096890-Lingulodinium_polyedra.AAC.1
MEEFARNYRRILFHIKEQIPEAVLRGVRFKQVKKSKTSALDIQLFERLEEEDPLKTHQGFLSAMDRHIARAPMVTDRERQARALSQG